MTAVLGAAVMALCGAYTGWDVLRKVRWQSAIPSLFWLAVAGAALVISGTMLGFGLAALS